MFDWDQLTREVGTPIYDQVRRDLNPDPAPSTRPARWTLGEVGIALLVVAILAGTVLLACLTGGPR